MTSRGRKGQTFGEENKGAQGTEGPGKEEKRREKTQAGDPGAARRGRQSRKRILEMD